MTSGIEEDTHVLLRLVIGQLGADFERMGNGRVEIDDLEVEVHHHLLRPGRLPARPDAHSPLRCETPDRRPRPAAPWCSAGPTL